MRERRYSIKKRLIDTFTTEGDRKAYYETYENTKKTNDQLTKDMKDENNQLRKEIANVQRGKFILKTKKQIKT